MEMETRKHGDMETRRHKNMETWRHGNIDTWKHGDTVMKLCCETKRSNTNQKPRRFSTICLSLVHRANRSLSFVRFLTKKQTEIIRLQAD